MNNEALHFWMEIKLRDAVNDPKIIMHALAMIKVGSEKGDPAEVIMRNVLADFVFTAFGISVEDLS